MSRPIAIAANAKASAPHAIRMDERDNVAIVANAGGLEAGVAFASGFAAGLVLRERVPQGHKVALAAIGEGEAVVRYGIAIGFALKPIAAARLTAWPKYRSSRSPPRPAWPNVGTT